MATHDSNEEDAGAAVHDVWVKRIVVLEETMRIPIEVLREEVGDLKEGVQEFKRLRVARDRAIARAAKMLTSGDWSKRARVEQLVVGDFKVDHISGDILADGGGRESGGG
jgi:hypothetical protein